MIVKPQPCCSIIVNYSALRDRRMTRAAAEIIQRVYNRVDFFHGVNNELAAKLLSSLCFIVLLD